MAFTDEVRAKLHEPLHKDLIKTRKIGGDMARFVEAHAMIANANRIFGEENWGHRVLDQGVDHLNTDKAETAAAVYWAVVEVWVEGMNGTKTDVGAQELRNSQGDRGLKDNVHNPDLVAMARKTAVSDGIKRALRAFGEQFGNGLYDTDGDVVKIMRALEQEPAAAVDWPARLASGKAKVASLAREAGYNVSEAHWSDYVKVAQAVSVADFPRDPRGGDQACVRALATLHRALEKLISPSGASAEGEEERPPAPAVAGAGGR